MSARVVIVIGLTLLIAYLDYVTPAYAFLIGFYFVPIYLAVWYCGRAVAAIVMAVSVAMSLYMTKQDMPVDESTWLLALSYASVSLVYLSWGALIFYLRSMFARLMAESETDSLTGLRSRKSFTQQAQLELARSARSGVPVFLAVVDLDNFKQVNDTLGHAAGDGLLVAVARCMRTNLRDVDIVGRMGGDEFMILLPATSAEEGRLILERLHRSLGVVLQSLGSGVSASMGAVLIPAGTRTTFDSILAQADQAMYAVKNTTKNAIRIVVLDDAAR